MMTVTRGTNSEFVAEQFYCSVKPVRHELAGRVVVKRSVIRPHHWVLNRQLDRFDAKLLANPAPIACQVFVAPYEFDDELFVLADPVEQVVPTLLVNRCRSKLGA